MPRKRIKKRHGSKSADRSSRKSLENINKKTDDVNEAIDFKEKPKVIPIQNKEIPLIEEKQSSPPSDKE